MLLLTASLVLSLIVITCPALTYAHTLLEVLRTTANASRFADFIESDPELTAIFLSPAVQTVYAPSDEGFDAAGFTSLLLRARQSGADLQNQQLQISNFANTLASQRTDGGAVVETNQPAPNTRRGRQVVVAGGQAQNSRRLARRAELAPRHPNTTDLELPPLRLFSGLGRDVTILKGDIPYDGGLVHTVTGFFTTPLGLSSTAAQTGLTTFNSLATAANLSSTLDNTRDLTSFVPSNDAFASHNSSAAPNLAYHVLADFVGYLPALEDGASLRTTAGTNVTVRVRGSDVFINDARIISSNLILENGVAHVLDRVLVPPNVAPPQVFTGSGVLLGLGQTTKFVMALSLMLVLSTVI